MFRKERTGSPGKEKNGTNLTVPRDRSSRKNIGTLKRFNCRNSNEWLLLCSVWGKLRDKAADGEAPRNWQQWKTVENHYHLGQVADAVLLESCRARHMSRWVEVRLQESLKA